MESENIIAGPSHSQIPEDVSSSEAPLRPLPTTHFYSIEYPGYVQPTSVPKAIENLGGQSQVDSAFRRGNSKSESILELKLRPGSSFAHPIPGEVLPTSNILLKVVKRRRKRREGDLESASLGEYTIEALGTISKTARFRSELCVGRTFLAQGFDSLFADVHRYGGLSVSTRY